MSKLSDFIGTLDKYPSEITDGVAVAQVFQEIDDRLSALEAVLKKVAGDFAATGTAPVKSAD